MAASVNLIQLSIHHYIRDRMHLYANIIVYLCIRFFEIPIYRDTNVCITLHVHTI